ncbi:ABC transporter ATP-binding protein [Paludibacterium paludis]|uniref:Hemin ABC transporter ATP-binding protein n=1 Tax=Paludibacterium paludis TaxID=1225769 RepID=A0A918UBJ6_9NEIS|nr:ABC transporter ATP-binding protein [Paludibacterium paludis]GGY25683.1 hemin ABC transporter ATP-binding protein [Paludibacterium paludis]
MPDSLALHHASQAHTAFRFSGRVCRQGRTILDPGPLTFPANSITAILGPNGSGKSTLLRCLAGLTPIENGEVTLFGKPPPSDGNDGRRLAWVGQHPQGDPLMSVGDYVMLGRRPWLGWLGRPGDEDRQRVRQALEQLELDGSAARPLGALSGGERQRAALARALVQGTPVLLLDEPTNHLDIRHQHLLMQTLRRLCLQGRSVVTVLHDLSLAANHADHLLLLDKGRAIATGSARHVLARVHLSQAYQWPMTARQDENGNWFVSQSGPSRAAA